MHGRRAPRGPFVLGQRGPFRRRAAARRRAGRHYARPRPAPCHMIRVNLVENRLPRRAPGASRVRVASALRPRGAPRAPAWRPRRVPGAPRPAPYRRWKSQWRQWAGASSDTSRVNSPAHWQMPWSSGTADAPFSVSEYSTRGGTSS